jgi:hypothetical protein
LRDARWLAKILSPWRVTTHDDNLRQSEVALMAYTLNERQLAAAFSGGTIVDEGRTIAFETHSVGYLKITSGLVVACDPLVVFDWQPFPIAVPRGWHQVQLAIACLPGGDERVAFARLRLAPKAMADRWELACPAGKQISELGEDEFFGYGVDSGTGCFMDPVALRLLNERMDQDEDYFNVIIDGMEQNYKHTWSWLDFCPLADQDDNIVCFHSGYGDGSYPSFFGYAGGDSPTDLVTDFMVLPPAEGSEG